MGVKKVIGDARGNAQGKKHNNESMNHNRVSQTTPHSPTIQTKFQREPTKTYNITTITSSQHNHTIRLKKHQHHKNVHGTVVPAHPSFQRTENDKNLSDSIFLSDKNAPRNTDQKGLDAL